MVAGPAVASVQGAPYPRRIQPRSDVMPTRVHVLPGIPRTDVRLGADARADAPRHRRASKLPRPPGRGRLPRPARQLARPRSPRAGTPGPPPRGSCAAGSGRAAHACRADPGQPGALPAVAGLGPGRAQRRFHAHRDRPALGASGGHGRARPPGQNVIISTPSASGKSLGYLLPALTAVLAGRTALYLAPTRALAADQLRAVRALGMAGCARRCWTGTRRRPSGNGRARTLPTWITTPGHAAPHAAAPAQPVERVPSAAAVRDRR